MCTTLKIFFVILLVNCDVFYAYNKDRLVRFELKDYSQFKLNHNYNEDSFLGFTERTAKYGYESEEHTIVTEDGYILTVFRFLKRVHCEKLKQPPVVLQHGLSVNAMNWLDPGPKTGLAYLMTDECYDVWMTNSRGTEFSRNHTKLDPNRDPEFWQFSFHEIGLYDFPAAIDYILTKTGNVKLSYITHSQGGAEFFAMASLRPEYLDKINVCIAMAPAVWISHIKWELHQLSQYWKFIYAVFDRIGIQEVLHKHSVVQEFLQYVCHSKNDYASKICSFLVANADGRHDGSVDPEALTLVFAHVPDGVSLKNLVHLSQLVMQNDFTQFDYLDENVKYYGRKTAPRYKLNHINVPIIIIYSDNDQLVNPNDVKTLREHLKNVPEFYRITDPKWNHMDYALSKGIPTFLFPKVNQWLAKYSY